MSPFTICGLIIFTLGIILAFNKKTNKYSKIPIGLGLITVIAGNMLPLFNMFGKGHNNILIGSIILGLGAYFGYVFYKFFTGDKITANDNRDEITDAEEIGDKS